MLYPWQKKQWHQFTQAFLQERLSHAYLLSGVAGLGKADFATAAAALLLCDHPDKNTLQSCGHCKSCQLFVAKTHPDFLMVVPHEKNHAIKIDQIRKLTQQLTQKPQRNGYQVVVISPADAMPVGAANALLKTLEEPPGDVIIFLVAHCLDQLPATIISRCQQLHFTASDTSDTLQWLSSQIQSRQDLSVLLSLADGAPLTAISLASENYTELRDAVLKHLLNVLQHRENPITPIVKWIKTESDVLFYALLTIAIDLSRIQFDVTDGVINCDCVGQLQKMASLISPLALQQWLENIIDKKRLCARGLNLNTQLLFEDVLLDWDAKVRQASPVNCR